MASIKLNTWSRAGLLTKLLTHRFRDEIAALQQARAEFAERLYQAIYSETERRKMNALPKGWLPNVSELKFQSAGVVAKVDLGGCIYSTEIRSIAERREPVERRVTFAAHQGHYNHVSIALEADHPLSIEWAKLEAARGDLEQAIAVAKAQANSVLASVTTTGRLKEVWPESAPFVADIEGEPIKLPPALPIASLNSLFALPVATAA